MDIENAKREFNSQCGICSNTNFITPEQFANHLRNVHCSRESGSFVCLYGENQVCSSLPVEGINDVDYEQHIYKHHVFINNNNQHHKRKSSSMSSMYSLNVNCEKWDVYSASQNLAAVLNNPNKMKQKDFFTKLWGEGFVELHHVPDPNFLPAISKQHFESYLKKLLKRYRRRSKLKKTNVDGSNSLNSHQNFPSLKTKPVDKFFFDVPDIYLKKGFDLSDPDTFNFVFPHIVDFIKAKTDVAGGATYSPSNRSKLIQEKLGHYLDMVEVQIAKQVSSKSDAFFHTMSSHDTLMENLDHTLMKVGALRGKIRDIDNSLVKNSLIVLKGVRSRNNYYLVLKKLKIMATVYQTQPTVKLLLSTFDYVAALDLIYTTKDLLNNELAGIQCFRHLSSELNEVIKMIDALMIGEVERYAINDLNRPLIQTETETLEKDKFLCIILGLLRRQCFSFIDVYWREIYATIKAAIKQAVIEIVAESDSPVSNHSENESTSLTLDEQLKLLTVDEWVLLLKNTSEALKIILERLKSRLPPPHLQMTYLNLQSILHYKVALNTVRPYTHNYVRQSVHDVVAEGISVCSATEVNSGKDPKNNSDTDCFLDEESRNIVSNKLKHLVSSTCQYVAERYAHLLSKRSLSDDAKKNNPKSASKSLNANNNWLTEQATLSQLNDISSYVDDLSSMCQKLDGSDFNFMTLKTAFKTEANKFMKKFHEDRLKKIDMILENETWKQTPVPIEFQLLVNNIVSTGKFLTYKLNKSSESTKSTADMLYINDEKFVVIGTVLLLINMVAEYCVRAENIILSAQLLLRYLADLLQQFNRKSCKLVLGGEAVSEKTGLTKITSSNLALLMRTLQLLSELIPLIRNHFSNLLPKDLHQSLIYLERVQDDLQSHMKDIKNKLLSIPSQIISAELRTWEAKPPVPSKAFQNLSKSLKKLHEVVSCILVEKDVHELFRKINSNFKDGLRERIIKMNIVNNGGPQHGVVITEMYFYLQDMKQMKALPESELNESSMNDLWSRSE